MSFAPQIEREPEALTDPKALLRVPVGLVSPLWPLFAGAAMGGATWWWMTRWARPANMEAMFGAVVEAEAKITPEPTTLIEPAIDMAETAVAASEATVEAAAEAVVDGLVEVESAFEAVAEPAIEAAAASVPEASAEPVFEALSESPAELEAVGGEAAPISPIQEAAPLEAVEAAPKPKKKSAPPKAD